MELTEINLQVNFPTFPAFTVIPYFNSLSPSTSRLKHGGEFGKWMKRKWNSVIRIRTCYWRDICRFFTSSATTAAQTKWQTHMGIIAIRIARIPEDTYVETVGLEWMRWRVVNKRWIWIPEVLLLKWRKPKLETNSEEIRRGSDSPFFLCATESSLLRLCTIEMSWLFALFNGNVLRWQRHPLPAWLKETDAKTIAILIYFSPNHETEAAASPA